MSFGSSTGALYWTLRFGNVLGRRSPRWQVQQVTPRAPPKLSLLMAATIWIIRRDVRFIAVSTASRSQAVSVSEVWQSRQFRPRAAEIIPIVSMNSSTGIPRRICTFLKSSSDIWGFGSCPRWPLDMVMPEEQTVNIPITTRIVRLELVFMLSPFPAGLVWSTVYVGNHSTRNFASEHLVA